MTPLSPPQTAPAQLKRSFNAVPAPPGSSAATPALPRTEGRGDLRSAVPRAARHAGGSTLPLRAESCHAAPAGSRRCLWTDGQQLPPAPSSALSELQDIGTLGNLTPLPCRGDVSPQVCSSSTGERRWVIQRAKPPNGTEATSVLGFDRQSWSCPGCPDGKPLPDAQRFPGAGESRHLAPQGARVGRLRLTSSSAQRLGPASPTHRCCRKPGQAWVPKEPPKITGCVGVCVSLNKGPGIP